MPNVFDGVNVDCCWPLVDACCCAPDERVLRAYSEQRYTGPMTAAQRAWCVAEAERAGEGAYRREELAALNDEDLARTVLSAWADYCRSQGWL